jgi:hypothetical protein
VSLVQEIIQLVEKKSCVSNQEISMYYFNPIAILINIDAFNIYKNYLKAIQTNASS